MAGFILSAGWVVRHCVLVLCHLPLHLLVGVSVYLYLSASSAEINVSVQKCIQLSDFISHDGCTVVYMLGHINLEGKKE